MSDETIKHLEILQDNINRMNHCSFQIKSLAITIVSALLAIYAASVGLIEKGNIAFLLVAILPTLIFWILDSFYLMKEKNFITTYNIVAGVKESSIEILPFEIAPDLENDKAKYSRVFWSFTEAGLYGSIIVMLLALTIIIHKI